MGTSKADNRDDLACLKPPEIACARAPDGFTTACGPLAAQTPGPTPSAPHLMRTH